MVELKYIARDSNVKGKPRVYFACHPNDFKYFEEISEEILEKQNCVIYYNNYSENMDYQDLALQLGQMQLFVVPITQEFLFEKNIALDFEFKFAKENNIPILPLMYGAGLEESFNEKCGYIQFLDKFKIDDTAISYSFKLNKFLSSVLISDEMIEKIKKAFDTHVFLSYRKKDRAYAQHLMKSIHKNDFFKDVAIWYDEFLTPGENFNEEINNALEKCDLFALTVTPNLLEEPNYVKDVEYKLAKQGGKPILPVELVKTDKEFLNQKFENIGNCINVDDDYNLVNEIEKVLKKQVMSSDDNLEHDYYIALAYLYGIDVEVDHEKGVKILKDLSNSYFINAMEKLADMYKYGDCIEANQSEEEELREEIIEGYKILIKDGEEYYRPLLAEAYNNLGMIKLEKSDYYYANLYFKKAIKTIKDFGLESLQDNVNYCMYHKNLANCLLICEDYKLAKKYVLNAINIMLDLKKHKYNVDDELADLYFSLGKINQNNQENHEAEQYFQLYLNMKKEQSQLDYTRYFKDIFNGYKALGEFYCVNDCYKEAKDNCEKALEICEKFSNDKEFKKSLIASIYLILGKIYIREKDYLNALKYLSMAMELEKEIIEIKKINILNAKRQVSIIMELQSLVYFYQGEYLKAENILLENIEDVFVFLMKFDILSYYDYHTPLYRNIMLLVDVYIKLNQPHKTHKYIELAERIVHRLIDTEYTDLIKKVEILERKQNIAALENDSKGATTYFSKRLNLLKELDSKKIENLPFEVIKCLNDVIAFNYSSEDFSFIMNALKICLKKCVNFVNNENSNACYWLGEVFEILYDKLEYLDEESKNILFRLKKKLLEKYYLGKRNYYRKIIELYFLLINLYEEDTKKMLFCKEIIDFYNKEKIDGYEVEIKKIIEIYEQSKKNTK